MEQVVAFLQQLISFEVSPAILVAVAAVIEFVLRFVKTPKALGLIHIVAKGIKSVALVVGLLAQAVQKIADLSDKVLPQKTEG